MPLFFHPMLAMLGAKHLIVLLVLLVPYFLPTVIAAARHKQNVGAIFALNLLLGWTLLGWVFALVWALVRDKPPVVVTVAPGSTVENLTP